MKKRWLRVLAGCMVAAMMLPSVGQTTKALAAGNAAVLSIADTQSGAVDLSQMVLVNGEAPKYNADGSVTFSGNVTQKTSFTLPQAIPAGKEVKVTAKLKFNSAEDTQVRFYMIANGNDMNTCDTNSSPYHFLNEGVGEVIEKSFTLKTIADTTEILFASGSWGATIADVTLYEIRVEDPSAKPKATPTPTPLPTPTPVPVYTNVGESLTVTADMVKNGEVTIRNAAYNEIMVPADLAIAKLNLHIVDVDKLVLESGANYTVNCRNALVDLLDITATTAEGMSYEALTVALEKARAAENSAAAVNDVINQFQESLRAKDAATKAKLNLIVLDSEIATLSVNANADINVAKATVENLTVSTKDAVSTMDVKVTGFNGDVNVNLDKGDRTYTAPLALKFNESVVGTLNAKGKEIFHVEGSESSVGTMTIADVTSVSTNLDTDTFVIDGTTKNANVRIYSDIQQLNVGGENNDIVLPVCAEIKNAEITGDTIRVYGYGTLGNAEITGKAANVAIPGTLVNGENDTTIPEAMREMNPWKDLTSGKQEPAEKDDNAINLKDVVYTTGNAPKYNKDGSITLGQNVGQKNSFKLPQPIKAGETIEVTVKMKYNSDNDGNVRFYTIADGIDVGTQEGNYVTIPKESVGSVITKSFVLTAKSYTTELMLASSWVPFVDITVYEIKVESDANAAVPATEISGMKIAFTSGGATPAKNADNSYDFAGVQKVFLTLPETVVAGDKIKVTVKLKFNSPSDSSVRFYMINGGDNNTADGTPSITNEATGTVIEKSVILTAKADSNELMFGASWGATLNDVTVYELKVEKQ